MGMFYKKKPELKPKKMTNQKNKPKERKIKKANQKSKLKGTKKKKEGLWIDNHFLLTKPAQSPKIQVNNPNPGDFSELSSSGPSAPSSDTDEAESDSLA